MKKEPVILDERAFAVAGVSYRLAWMVLAFGVLASVAVRSLVLHQAAWDLLALVVVSGWVSYLYQRAKHVRVLPRHWALLTVVIGAVVGLVVAFVLVRLLALHG